MPIEQEDFDKYIDNLGDIASRYSLSLFENIREYALILVDNPFSKSKIDTEFEAFISELTDWSATDLAEAYRDALDETDSLLPGVATETVIASETLFVQQAARIAIPDSAKEILEDYPGHWRMYDSFRQAINRDFEQMQPFILRDVQDKARDLQILAGEADFGQADTFTRKTLTQDLLNRFANQGITGIQYKDGRTIKIDSYARMLGRTMTNNAARQATMTRAQQYGVNEVVISVHYPCSDLCIDEQGEIYSIAAGSDRPPLSEAIAGGLYHVNCKHHQTPYIEGITGQPNQTLSDAENEIRYEAQQKQRYMERQIRHWKRRKEMAITDAAEKKANSKIRSWQADIRQHLDENNYLRRNYDRESLLK